MENYLLIECLECSVVFRKQAIEETDGTVFCKCKNLSVGIKKAINSTPHVAVTYSKTSPRIYELANVKDEKKNTC